MKKQSDTLDKKGMIIWVCDECGTVQLVAKEWIFMANNGHNNTFFCLCCEREMMMAEQKGKSK